MGIHPRTGDHISLLHNKLDRIREEWISISAVSAFPICACVTVSSPFFSSSREPSVLKKTIPSPRGFSFYFLSPFYLCVAYTPPPLSMSVDLIS